MSLAGSINAGLGSVGRSTGSRRRPPVHVSHNSTSTAISQAVRTVATSSIRSAPLTHQARSQAVSRERHLVRHAQRLAAHRQRVRAKQARVAANARSRSSVFGHAPGRIEPGRKAIQGAVRAERKAADRLPQSRAYPRFPTLRHYTPAQRALIISSYARAGRAHPLHAGDRAHGLNPSNALDHETRRQLRQVYGRATREQRVGREARYMRHVLQRTHEPRGAVSGALVAAGQPSFLQGIRDALPPPQQKRLTNRQLSAMYRRLDPTRDDQLKAGHRKPGDGGGGGLTLATVLSGGIHPVAGQTLARFGHVITHDFLGPIARDAIDIPAQLVPSLYQGLRAFSGDHKKLQQLQEQTINHDPVALAVQGRFKEAARAAAAHPLGTALEVQGVARAPGIGIGAALRRVPGEGKFAVRARDLGSTKREPARRELTGVNVPRKYSRDPFLKGLQVTFEKRAIRHATEHRTLADQADALGNHEVAAHHRRQANAKDPRVASDEQVHRLEDINQDTTNQLQRHHRENVFRELRGKSPREKAREATKGAKVARAQERAAKVDGRHVDERHWGKVAHDLEQEAQKAGRGRRHPGVTGRQAAAAVVLRAQKIAPGRTGLEAYRQQIEDEYQHGDLSVDTTRPKSEVKKEQRRLGPKRKANRALASQIDKALKGETDWAAVQDAADRYATASGTRQAELVRRGILSAHEAQASVVKPYAQSRMGARWDHQGTVRQAHREGEIQQQLGVLEHDIRREKQALVNATGAERQRIRATIQRRESAQAKLLKERPKPAEGLVHVKDGRVVPLTVDDVRQHMIDAGENPDTAAYISHKPKDANAYYAATDRPPSIGSSVRTGDAFRQGVVRGDAKVLPESVARQQTLLDQEAGFRRRTVLFGEQRPRVNKKGETIGTKVAQYANRGKAEDRIRQLEHQGLDFVAVRGQPFLGRPEQYEHLLDSTSAEQQLSHDTTRKAMESALNGVDGPGPWILMDKAAQTRALEHLARLNPSATSRAAQAFFGAFRRAVLYTSTKWPVGNVVEAAVRAGIKGAVPGYHNHVFNRVMDTFEHQSVRDYMERHAGTKDPQELHVLASIYGKDAREALQLQSLPGGHLGGLAAREVHRGYEQFAPTSKLGKLAKGLHYAFNEGKVNPLRLPAGLWREWSRFVVAGNNHAEQFFNKAIAGKHIRQELMPPRTIAHGEQAYLDAAKGLRGTDAQIALLEDVQRAFGAYSAFSPGKRWFISQYAPFMPWAINAFNFIYRVMPREHPLMTGLIAAAYLATEKQREALHQSKFGGSAADGTGPLPDFLQGSIIFGDGGKLPLSRYLPVGAVDEFPGNIQGFFLPQLNDAFAAFNGTDWTGKKQLRNPDGTPIGPDQRVALGISELFKSTVPVLGIAERVKKRGVAALNPFAVIPPQTRGGGSSGGGGPIRPGQYDFSGGAKVQSIKPGDYDFGR